MKLSVHRHRGFTLIEMLVASAVLALMLVLFLSMIDSTAKLTSSSHQRIGADSGGRQALDRIGTDWARAVFRPDLPDLIEKINGNDRITFYVYADGYFDPPLGTNDDARRVSKISYQAPTNILLRGAEGTRWKGPAGTLSFSPVNTEPTADTNSEVASQNVFRFETAFLLKNGDIKAAAPGLNPQNATNSVSALIVGVAALDSQARTSLDATELSELVQSFPDANDGEDILSAWRNALDDPGISRPVAKAVRVYQRYYFLEQ